MKHKNRAKIAIIGAVAGVIGAIIMFSVVSHSKDSLKYYWDEDYKASVDFLNLLGWGVAVLTVFNIIQAIAYGLLTEHEEQSDNNTGLGASSDVVRCVYCNSLISNRSNKCIHCGRPVLRQTGDIPVQGQMPMQIHKNIPVSCASKNTTRKCLFCDLPISDEQNICGACGRRQD